MTMIPFIDTLVIYRNDPLKSCATLPKRIFGRDICSAAFNGSFGLVYIQQLSNAFARAVGQKSR